MASKKAGVSCPICDCIVPEDVDINVHVNKHFDEVSTSVKCSYPDSHLKLNKSALDDHIIAHIFKDNESDEVLNKEVLQEKEILKTIDGNLNDSALAKAFQEEEYKCKAADENVLKDEELARHLQSNEKEKQESEDFKKLQERYGMNSNGGFVKQYDKVLSKNVGKKISVGEYYDKKASMLSSLVEGEDSSKSKTADVIEALTSFYTSISSKKKLIYLSVPCDHYSADIGDSGWGCGYRNLQMLISSLLKHPLYCERIAEKIGKDAMPSIPMLQTLIERAWTDGFDRAGCSQLGGKLKHTKKWIGTTEVAALLRWMSIRARIVDFHTPSGDNRTHPKMFQWLEEYYKNKKDETSFPIYLQHEGHSRTCFGVERKVADNSLTLMIFDPSHSSTKMKDLKDNLSNHETCKFSHLSLLRRSISQLKYDQFQVLYIDGVYTTHDQIQKAKIISSVRIP